MIDKKNNTNKGPDCEKSLTSFGRWFCGLDLKSNVLNNPSFSNPEQRLSVNKTSLNSSVSGLNYSHNRASRNIRNNRSEGWYKSLGQSFASWCTHDWLRPLPGLSVVSVETFAPSTSSTKGAFYKYGSDFLRYKKENVKNVNRKCSRMALFLAGTASGRVFNNTSYVPRNLSSVTTLGSSLSSRMSNSAYQPFSQRWALDNSVESWSNTLQFSTAIAVAIPIAISTVQVMSSLHTPTQEQTTTKDAIVPNAVDTTPSTAKTAEPTVAAPAPVPFQISKPTGKIANIQSYVLPAKGEFSSKYGWRWGRMHRGIDIAGPVGTPIVAAAAGKVISAGWNYDGFGNRVEILHPDGTVTLYAHTNKVLTKVGKQVHQGELIAEMGSTGNSTGPHLHFQVHPKGKEAVDPMSFIGKQLNTLEKSPTI
jgi:murein DD-endopeptidase MepM/ murein hydrolase activator NlpD